MFVSLLSSSRCRTVGVAAVLMLALAPAAARADDHDASGTEPPANETDAERIERLEETVGVLASELDSLAKSIVVPEEKELVSVYGFGPAASKVYLRERGLSIGGYGEVRLRGQVADENGDGDVFDALRGVLYFGYKFNDWIIFNSEFEFEHAGSGGGGSASIEFMSLDFLLHETVNARAGLLLLPMGFVNEIHEPVFFHGNERPEPERRIIPSTFRENGAGLFGSFGDLVQYRIYAVNGLDATGLDDNGLRGGRQKGSEALSDHWAFVGRVDLTPIAGLVVGGSVYTGKAGQNQLFDIDGTGGAPPAFVPDTPITIWEAHVQWQARGARVRGLWTQAHLDQAGALTRTLGATSPIASRMVGGYVELGYDVLPLFCETEMAFEPFYRFEHLDTQDRVPDGFARNASRSRDIHVVGFSFKPHPQVVIKLDYRNIDSDGTDLPDEVQAGIGFVF